jgi:hypothetical protein
MPVMKYFRLLFLAFLAAFCSNTVAQELQVNFASPTLPSSVSDWSSNPSLITILLNPGSGGLELHNAHIVIEITAAGKAVASTVSKFSEQPAIIGWFTTARTYRWPEIFNPNAVSLDQSIQASAIRSGMLPAGEYELCIRLVDASGQLIGNVKSGCRTFRVIDIEPPRLLTPINNMSVPATAPPRFTWTPVVGASTPVHYHVKLVEVLSGQSSEQALESNAALFEKNDISTNFLAYPNTAPSLGTGSGNLIWQVQALDASNNPVGKNRGKSTLGAFTVKKSEAGTEVTAAGNGCTCGCGGTPRPYCAHADCKCAQGKQIIGDSATAVGKGNGCACGCGGTPRPGCAYKDCKCSQAKLILRDNTGTVLAGNGCTCGCGGTAQPACAHKDCKCANAKVIRTSTYDEVSKCACGCGGTPKPTCAHKDCACANTDAVRTADAVSKCTCGCGGTPKPTCAHKGCVCAQTNAIRVAADAISKCTCGCGGTPKPTCAHKDCVCAKAKAVPTSAADTEKGNGCDCGCGGTPKPTCAHKDCKCAN